MSALEARDRADIFVTHAYREDLVDLGEVRMNYAVAGSVGQPALLLLPAQVQSWWSYEDVMGRLADHFQVYAVDLRGQGRSTRTPGRYTLDNMGNDLVRFLDLVVARPAIVSGNSSGGVLAAWLAAYAKPGQVRGVVCEDPPLFASEVSPACGHSIRQSIGPLFALSSTYLGDQWTVGDWAGMQAAVPRELPRYVLAALARMQIGGPPSEEPPQNFKEYDPEWARAFWTGTAGAGCDHARMLASARAPILLTHHYREIDPDTGGLMGAVSDEQVRRARELVIAAGSTLEVVDLPDMVHAMHSAEPGLFTQTLVDWAVRLPDPRPTQSA
ncbi:MAG: alpha/beta hydrolase [Solirubrobacterales bacterium]|nr:alpha/beta hydrolase [Solirubrobacterales bacterium]